MKDDFALSIKLLLKTLKIEVRGYINTDVLMITAAAYRQAKELDYPTPKVVFEGIKNKDV